MSTPSFMDILFRFDVLYKSISLPVCLWGRELIEKGDEDRDSLRLLVESAELSSLIL